MNFAFKLGLNSYRCMNEIEFPYIVTRWIPSLIEYCHCKGPAGWFKCKVGLVVLKEKNLDKSDLFLTINEWKTDNTDFIPGWVHFRDRKYHDIAIIELPGEFTKIYHDFPENELERINDLIKEMGIK